MRILGIETSCDETAVCLIEAQGPFGPHFHYQMLGNALYSQIATHAPYGGVFPNLAKREHEKNLTTLLVSTLKQADELKKTNVNAMDVSAVLSREPGLARQLQNFLNTHEKPHVDVLAVTVGPGLEPALWVGVNFTKALAAAWHMPVVAVNHMEGHIVLSMMQGDHVAPVEFPALALLISGGHTELVLIKEFGRYELLGQTRDDAAGEAFDKVARLLGLPYPGGPDISRLAAEARSQNSKGDFFFTRPMLHSGDLDFSFSGLKTAVRNLVAARPMTEELKLQIAREFEECIADVLVAKTLRAADMYGAKAIVLGGGVSANLFIREKLAAHAAETGVPILVPPPELATDNALMIALSGYFHALRGKFTAPSALRATGSLRINSVQ